MVATQSTAAACAPLGDVHIICRDGSTASIYVEAPDDTKAQHGTHDCCLPGLHDVAGAPLPQARQQYGPRSTRAVPPHTHTHTTYIVHAHPRAPPLPLLSKPL